MTTCRAAVFAGDGTYEVREFPMPETPVPSSGRVRNTAPVANEVHVALPSYSPARAAPLACTGPIV